MTDELPDLMPATADHVAAALRSTLGAAPVAGPLIAEIVTAVIPRQRLDRLVEFVQILDEKLLALDRDLVKQKAKTEEFIDLLEDALRQATRALSPERLRYIASTLKNSIPPSALSHVEKKRVAELLGELNDVEVIILACEGGGYPDAHPFRERHKPALTDPLFNSAVSSEGRLRGAIYSSYREKLRRLGLLEQEFRVDIGNSLRPTPADVRIVPGGDSITPLGRVVLAAIDARENIPSADDRPQSTAEHDST